MSKSAFIRTRIEPKLKNQTEKILHDMGVTPSQVVSMLYRQIQRTHELPLEFSIPNAETARAIMEAREKSGIESCKNVKDLFDKLDI